MPRPKLTDTEKLVSFTARFTHRQLARLERLSTADGLPVQEHVRRALDAYVLRHEMAAGMSQLPYDVVPGTDMRPYLPALVGPVQMPVDVPAQPPVSLPPTPPGAPATDPVATAPVPPPTPPYVPTTPLGEFLASAHDIKPLHPSGVDALLDALKLPEIGDEDGRND